MYLVLDSGEVRMSGRKILIIGGTGVISSAVLGMLAKSRDTELYVINRGHRPLPPHYLKLDTGYPQAKR